MYRWRPHLLQHWQNLANEFDVVRGLVVLVDHSAKHRRLRSPQIVDTAAVRHKAVALDHIGEILDHVLRRLVHS